MPTITNRPTTTTTSGTSATNAATGTAPTSAPSSATTTGAAWQPPPLRSASGDIIPTKRVEVNGLAGGTMNATGTTSRFARDASFDSYTAPADGAVARAFIRTDATPIPGGCRLNVQSFHKQKDDKVTLWLLAEVLDTETKQLRTITLSVLAKDEVLNPGSFRGDLHYDINYDDVNKFLQARNPKLKLNPGHTSLAVAARWSNGHQAGGFGRGGVFRLPPAGTTHNVIGVRTAARTGEETDLPLDMQVAYPAELVAAVPQLKPDGDILSRLESELKGNATKQEMTAAITKMYDLVEKALAGDKQAVESALGKGWTVETVNRYWLKDDGSSGQPGTAGTGLFAGFRVDEDGLPIQDPMTDTYMDDANLGMTRTEGAIRLRTNAQATVMNIKPGGGREDDRTRIRQRIEYGLEMKAGTTPQAAGQAMKTIASNNRWSGTVFNQAQREVGQLDANVVLSNALQPWIEIKQDRHKFTIKNEAGVEIELSLDKVKAKTLRPNLGNADGTPREVEFFVLEAELDHLQLASTNQGTYAAAGTNASSHFTNDAQQDTWLKATSDDVTMDIDPRLHELKDLQNESFRSTGSYRAFEKSTAKVVPFLFPNGLQHGRQKAAHAADVLGLVHFDDKSLMKAVKDLFEGHGYKWSDALKQKYEALLTTPANKMKIEQNLLNGNQNNVYNFLRYTVGNVALELDVAKMKQRVKDQLHALGFESSAPIEAMFDALATKNIAPNYVESYFQRMGQVADNQVLAQWAQALGVSPAPIPVADPKRLFGEDKPYGQLLRQQMEQASVDPKTAPEVEAFFAKAIDSKKVTLQTIRSYMQSFAGNPENYLTTVANAAGLTAELPTLRAQPQKIIALARQHLAGQYLEVDSAMEKFLAGVCATSSRLEATQFAATLRSNAQAMIDTRANLLGVTAPKLAWDFAAIDTKLKTTLNNVKIAWTPALEDFTHKAIDGGVPVAQLERAYAQLQSQASLKQALVACGIYVVGLPIPDVEYDKAATSAWVAQSLAGYQAVLGSSAQLDQYTDECLQKGLTPSQIVNFSTYSLNSGKAAAARYAPSVPVDQLPDVPLDLNNLVAHWKTRFGTQWTPEREKYLSEAFPKARANGAFRFNYVFNQSYTTILSQVQSHSGVARPTGV